MQHYVTPRYIFREEAFRKNYKHFEDVFKSRYSKFRIAYSFKTNYTPYICRIVNEFGGYAEVTSMMEYRLAKKIGFKDDRIIFNGPSKEEFPECILNVDNLDELKVVKNKKIGVRVNIDVGQPFISRFGITDVEQAFEIAGDRIVGLHCHISQARSLESWKKRTEVMIALADRYFSNRRLEYIDLGGGMCGDMPSFLRSQFPESPTYDQYAAVTAKIVSEHSWFNGNPVLFAEPGAALISGYIDFATKVVSIKEIRGKVFIELNCSKHNLGEICELKKLPYKVIPCGNTQVEINNADLVGYTCLEHDVIFSGFCGKLAIGDIIVFENVGGYSLVNKPPFIRPNCEMVTETGKVIKRAETEEEIFETYE